MRSVSARLPAASQPAAAASVAAASNAAAAALLPLHPSGMAADARHGCACALPATGWRRRIFRR